MLDQPNVDGPKVEGAVDREAFENVAGALENGSPLTFEMIGDVFGKEFWLMLTYCFLDAQSAARAIDLSLRKAQQRKK